MSFMEKLKQAEKNKSLKKEAELWWKGRALGATRTVQECKRLLEIYAELINSNDPKTQAEYTYDRPRARLQLIMETLKLPGKGDILNFTGHNKEDLEFLQSEVTKGLAEVEKMILAKAEPHFRTISEKDNPFVYHMFNDYLKSDYAALKLIDLRKTYQDFQKKLST